MPRDGSGTYTLPAGNPVVSGTIIDVTWANPTMSDVATALTDSLSRTGSGGMLVPFLNADGAVGSPGISWVNESTSGLYRAGLNDQRMSSSGVDIVQFITDPDNPLLVFSGGAFRSVLNIFAPYTIVGDWTWEGRLVTDDSTLTRAGFNIPLGVEPTVPVEGDFWKTATDLFAFVNGGVQSLLGAAQAPSTTEFASLRANAVGGWVENVGLLQEANVLFIGEQAANETSRTTFGQLWVRDDAFDQSLMYTTFNDNEFEICSINQSDVNSANIAVPGAAPSWSEILVSQPKANQKYVFQCSFQASFDATDDMNVELVIDTTATFSGTISWVGGGSTPGSAGLHSAIGEVITNIVPIDTDGSVSPNGVYVTIIGTLINGNQSATTMSLRVSKQADVGANGIVYLGAGFNWESVQSL